MRENIFKTIGAFVISIYNRCKNYCISLLGDHRDNNTGNIVKSISSRKKSSINKKNDITVVNVKVKKVVVKKHKNEN